MKAALLSDHILLANETDPLLELPVGLPRNINDSMVGVGTGSSEFLPINDPLFRTGPKHFVRQDI